MLRTFADLTASLVRLPDQIDKGAAKGALAAAVLLKAAVAVAEGRNAGKPIAQVKIVPLGAAQVEVKMASRKAHLLDHDTRPHDIAPKAKQALMIAGSDHPIARTRTPGTKGNLAWEKAVAAATPKMLEVVAESIPAAIIAAFRG